MTTNPLRTLAWLLAALVALVAACSAPTATPTPIPAPTGFESLAPTDGAVPSTSALPPTSTPDFPPTPTPPLTTPGPTLPAGPIAGALAAQLDSTLADQLAADRIPGMSAEIIFPDGSRWSGGAGQADIGRDLAVTPETTFVVGSITKTFVTAAVMKLQEEGVLSIDDPLSGWVPDYPNAENITLAHLASHTSGLFDYFAHPEYNLRVFNEPDHHWTPQEILDNFVLEPHFEPGARYKYSNTNFVLLGMVIVAATGDSVGEVLDDRFIGPLGLDNTFVQSEGPPAPGSARGYLQRPTGPIGLDDGTDYRPTLSAATVAYGAGDIVSTAADLADWARTIYGGHLLSAESVALMTDYNYSQYARGEYGLGTRTRVFDGARMFGHTGSLRGFAAAMWHFPETDLTIVVLTNRGRIEANPIVDALAALALPIAEAHGDQ